KSKQLEAANSSLQRWMEEVEKRKEQQAQEEKQALPQPTAEEIEAQRRRQEEIERALAEKKRKDEEEAKRKEEEENRLQQEREAALKASKSEPQVAPPAVWEEEIVERKKGSSRGAILLLVILALVLAAAATLWFWDDIQTALGWGEGELVPDTEEMIVTATEVAPSFVPAVVSQQPGMCYVLVASFTQQQSREMITLCSILRSAGYTPEALATSGNKFAVSVGKYRTANEAKIALNLYAQRYGQKYGQPWIFP
ncbi:MAG: hypothetical protein LBU92_06150, partial [Prevotellaceae bacterium]|nr:hypothetical protein [Prevotellaceae bacterium]